MLILLDIDGVMVPAKGWKAPELLQDGFPAFSNKAVEALKQLLSDDTIVVLTTSHKSKFTIGEWKKIFRNRGLEINHVIPLPENSAHVSRKEEILNWFRKNEVNANFVIIDDDTSLNDLPDVLKNNLVQTSPYIGLTEDHVGRISSILNDDGGKG
ncbi:MAG: HAD domain-containing protein [Flavihumibacter sp.]